MNIILVTDEQVNVETQGDSVEVLDVQTFISRASGEADEEIVADKFFFDVNAANMDNDIYEAVMQLADDNGDDFINWVTFRNEAAPVWFTGELSENPFDGEMPSAMSEAEQAEIASALGLLDQEDEYDEEHTAKVITFGSAKGGSGKTFTSIITARQYAKDHPNKKVALLDLDVEEPQVCAAIKVVRPNVKDYLADYQSGDNTFENLQKCRVNSSNRNIKFPKNLDFYLSPRDFHPVKDELFWLDVMGNLICNYDAVFIDTGTTYMQVPAIAYAYKVADKIMIVTMANLPSSVTVSDQIRRLTGSVNNDVYSVEDELEEKIYLAVTNARDKDEVCQIIISHLEKEAPICAVFGDLASKINRCQVMSEWDIFDDNKGFINGLREIYMGI